MPTEARVESARAEAAALTASIVTDDATSGFDLNRTPSLQSGSFKMKGEGIELKEAAMHTFKSPERSSLLPPFTANQARASHLPTPLSPGNLANYLSGPTTSPSTLDHTQIGPGRYHSTLHPSSRPGSAQPPQTPRRSLSTSQNTKITSYPQASLEDLVYVDTQEISSTRAYSSQVATPSPEIFKSRRASVDPSTPSDSETMLATPHLGKRSSSDPYSGSIAPAPIISPAHSIHSTVYQASPTFEEQELQPAYSPSQGMASLVSDHDNHDDRATPRHQAIDHDDPFIARDEGNRTPTSRQRYLSPARYRSHCSTHANVSPLIRPKSGDRASLEQTISKLVMSPSEFSDTLSHGSPMKVEDEDRKSGGILGIQRALTSESGTPSQVPASPRTPPPTRSARASQSHTPVPEITVFRSSPPATGGEIERIRQQQILLEEARAIESEKRRPEYLTRVKRGRDGADDEVILQERENSIPGLGVTVTPSRGRRLKLYQPVPIASGAAVLRGGGEGEDIDVVEVVEPKTPPPLSTVVQRPSSLVSMPTISLRAIDWRTPESGHSPPGTRTEEDELKKQRRLKAFAAPKASGKGRCMKPVEIFGQGRVIIDVTSIDVRHLTEVGSLKQLPDQVSEEDQAALVPRGHGAEWPDKEYPWSVQEQQRDELEEIERRNRLAWIERFLDRDSDSEDGDNDRVAGPSTWNQDADASVRGRGKTVSVTATPHTRRTPNSRLTFSASCADARQVLLSKKYVRALAERVRQRKIAEEEEGIVMCICQGGDDGRPMVRCDECRTWYHLICMDIHDESELAEEWYCWKCLPSAEDPPPPPRSEPTFAPVMPESPPRAGVGDQPLYQSALQPSPMPASPMANRWRDRSPVRRSRLPGRPAVGDPGDPVQGGPSTPYHPQSSDSRLYSTPKYDEYSMDDHAPFDPTSTPSRGLKFPNPGPITPRRGHLWNNSQSSLWATPSGPPQTPQFSSAGASSSGRSSMAYSLSTLEDSAGPSTSPWVGDESPIRRRYKGAESSWPYPPRHMLDSPLAMRGSGLGHRPFLAGVEDSPTARYLHKGLGKDTEEHTPRAGQGKSPRRE